MEDILARLAAEAEHADTMSPVVAGTPDPRA